MPVTLHISHGLLHGGGAQHSESPFGMYWNLPGIEIAAPSGAKEVKGLLTTAIKSDNPTIVLTHAFGYGAEDDVPDGDFEIPFGQANVKREGGDVTIVACSMMTSIALGAAEELAGRGHQRRGDRPPDAGPARRADDPRLGRQDRAADRRRRGPDALRASPPRSPRWSARRRSTR